MFGEEELIKLHRSRATTLIQIIVFAFIVIIGRLWYLQVYKGELYHRFSIENRLRKEIVRAPRGLIYSRDKDLIVDNIPRFDATLTRQFLKDKAKTLGRLSLILNMPQDEIEKIIEKNSYQAKYRPIVIKKNLTLKEVALIETENAFLPGVSIQSFISREYKDKEIGAHLLGYISEISPTQLPLLKKRDALDYTLGDFIGQSGIEEKYDLDIRGENGFEYVEVDALGRKKRYINTDNLFKGIENKNPKPGNDLILTIDRDMQIAGFKALEGKTGSVVALDIHSGEVLTMVSTPAFDPSQFSRGISSDYWQTIVNNEENPMRDRNIQEHFSPGSTFKVITAIAALEEKIIDSQTKIRCHGTFNLGRAIFRSWKKFGEEKVDVVDALMQSCNVFFYKVASEIDIDILAKYASAFGFGQKTGISLSREVSGNFPTKDWKKMRTGESWQQGETLHCAIGQSYVLATPMQLALAYAAIANKGTLYRPFVVKEIVDQKQNLVKKFEPEIINKIKLKEETWNLIHKGLYKVVNNARGTAFWKRGQGNQMAGKTGTSQVIKAASEEALYSKCSDMPYKFRHHGLFVAFAPYDNPRIAVAALVEHGCGGSSAAAPVVEKVVNSYMKKYLPQDQEKYFKMEQGQLRNLLDERKKSEQEVKPLNNALEE